MSDFQRPAVAATAAELRALLAPIRAAGGRIGFVPTMGALHEGHLSLVQASRAECAATVVSIYVNPSQFGPNEDLSRYPRTFAADLDLLAGEADIVFAPASEEMYPPGFATWVVPGGVAEPLEGAHRPDHFRGVATIVLKLLNLVQPSVAYFGQKDYQQARVIEQMVDDLSVPVTICVCPIVRDADGLALSSRNRYLSPAARDRALVLSQALARAEQLVGGGERRADTIVAAMREVIQRAPDAAIDYVALVDGKTLATIEWIAGPAVTLLAVRIENTRLIDNAVICPHS